MKQIDRDNMAKIYSESAGQWPRDPGGEHFDDPLYSKISEIVYQLKGASWDEIKEALSQQLDVRLDNMYGSNLEKIVHTLYQRVNS